MDITREKLVLYTDTENYLILKYREAGTPWAKVITKLSKATGNKRTSGAVQQHFYTTLKGKTSKDFENHSSESPTSPKIDVLVQVKPFRNTDSQLKQDTRAVLGGYIVRRMTGDSSVLSLPADNFVFEKYLMQEFKRYHPENRLNFLCYERVDEVYARGLPEATDLKIQYCKADIVDMIPRLKSPFNGIWLDFCCMYNSSVVRCLQAIASNQLLADNGIMGLTMMYGREPNIDQLIPFLKDGEARSTENLRFRAIPRYITDIVFHGDLQLHRILKYHDLGENNQAAPMLLYIFEKTKEPVSKKGVLEMQYRPL